MSSRNHAADTSGALTDAGISVDKKTFLQLLTEDWWAVILGSIIIVTVLYLASNGTVISLPTFKWESSDELSAKILSAANLLLIAEMDLIFLALASVAIGLSGGNVVRFAGGFALIYLLAIVSFIIGGNKSVSYFGLVFVLLIGIALGNLIQLPSWLKEAVRSEFYIKTGLVVLGTTILSADLIKAGLPGIIQAIIVATLNGLRTVWFAIAFISIEMEAKFSSLVKLQGGKPAFTFVTAQIFNIFWTLLWSYILFGGSLFPITDFNKDRGEIL